MHLFKEFNSLGLCLSASLTNISFVRNQMGWNCATNC